MTAKYIRNQYKFLVFDKSIVHSEIARQGIRHDILIHGAGFFELVFKYNQLIADCSGKSVSLNVGVRRDDNEKILSSIGVQVDSEIEYAKYVIWRGKVIVFDKELDYKKVASGAFHGSFDCESSGRVKLFLNDNGKVVIDCKSEDNETGSHSQPEDFVKIAELFSLQRNIIKKP